MPGLGASLGPKANLTIEAYLVKISHVKINLDQYVFFNKKSNKYVKFW